MKNKKTVLLMALLLGQFAFALNMAKAQPDTSTEADTSLPSFNIGGFVQQQFAADQTSESPSHFSIHRARIGVTGNVTDHISVNLIGGYIEPPNGTPRLVNAFIDFDIHPLLQVRTGQFLLPFGLEGPEVIIFNPAIERSTAIRRLNTFTMFRDVGVQISGKGSIFNYSAAVVNGTGANQTAQIEPRDVIGRVGFTPTENLEVGLSVHTGQYQPDPTIRNYESRIRAGADINYEGEPLLLRGEYIIRRDDRFSEHLEMNGGYLLTGYKLTDKFETLVRYDYYDENTSSDGDWLTSFTIGANYYFVGNTRLSVNYEFRDDQLNPELGNLLTVQMQLAL